MTIIGFMVFFNYLEQKHEATIFDALVLAESYEALSLEINF